MLKIIVIWVAAVVLNAAFAQWRRNRAYRAMVRRRLEKACAQ